MSADTIVFDVTKEELDIVVQIADRVLVLCKKHGIAYPSRMDLMMDLQACHANGCPLDFAKLLAFTDADFSHDIFGIRRHISRKNGKLGACFLPRCAQTT